MINGDKIKLLTPMGVFTNVGEICEVVDVNKDGVISFRFGKNREHLGCMSYNEFEKYFELVKKNTWTAWERYKFAYNNLEGSYKNIWVEYRTNGKVVQLRACDYEKHKFIKVSSTCRNTDVFSLNTGCDIAEKRLRVKLLQEELDRYIRSL